MTTWLNWRMALSAILLAAVFATALFASADRSFTLSGLDLFFATTTVVSLGFNLWQLIRDRYKYAPLKDGLIGLFNDLKGRGLRAYQRQLVLWSPVGMSLPLEAIRLEFADFTQETIQSFEQVREHVVAVIHTLDPQASTQQVFRAAEFGLSAQEQRFRQEGMERFIENARREGPLARQPSAEPPPPEPAMDMPHEGAR